MIGYLIISLLALIPYGVGVLAANIDTGAGYAVSALGVVFVAVFVTRAIAEYDD